MNRIILLLLALATPIAVSAQSGRWLATDGEFAVPNFAFRSGERLPELRLHYTTLGTPHLDAKGQIDNAVMVLHGTGGSGKAFLVPVFADELYGPGAPLDITKTYVILPDGIGHGQSSKPSDGLHMAFPKYDYDDMVEGQQLTLAHLGVTRLKLLLGTSMGCMQAFVWGETHPGFARRLAPFACNAVEIAGRNRMWRKMSIDAIEADPLWQGGSYTQQPKSGVRTATDISIIAGANALGLQTHFPTRVAAEAALDAAMKRAPNDANDTIYQLDASRNYDPSKALERITVPVLWINSEDDFINPPELRLSERDVRRMPRARFILIGATPETRGHGTHTSAKFWKDDLAKLLATPALP